MKLKRFSIIAIILGSALLLAGIIVGLLNGFGLYSYRDVNTLLDVMLLLFNSIPLCLVMFGAVFVLTGAFCLIFKKAVTAYCSIKTTLIAVLIAIITVAGIDIFLVAVLFGMFDEVITFRILGLVALVLLFVFVALFAYYCYQRTKKESFKGVLIDFSTYLLYLPCFISLFSCLMRLL